MKEILTKAGIKKPLYGEERFLKSMFWIAPNQTN